MNISRTEQETALKKLFCKHFETSDCSIQIIPPSGSNRVYYILENEQRKAIGVYGQDLKENRTSFYFSELFTKYNLNVPKILEKGNNKGLYLISYLSGKSLLGVLLEKGYTKEVKDLYKKSLTSLVQFQTMVLEQIDFSMCHAASSFDKEQVFSDLMYFKYYFLDIHPIEYNRVELFKELQELSKSIASIQPKTFMYRDFQGRNILIDEKGVPGFIDFQGGMKGIPQYDVASLLWQAKAALPEDWKRELFNFYFELINNTGKWINLNEIEFRKHYFDMVLLRILQTLGAYGFRGLIEKKQHFIQSIYPALLQLKNYLADQTTHIATPHLRDVLEKITDEKILEIYQNICSKEKAENAKLKIKVYSFSYKKGPAKDTSGNGGGFVFDCRGILNPGRQEAYKTLTGKDQAVISYLETETEMPQFLAHVFGVIDLHIQDFLKRGFENLNISFGCTGGQHRSVYAAEQTVKHIQAKFGLAHVQLLHLEQDKNNEPRMS